jgi:hypothetical protein
MRRIARRDIHHMNPEKAAAAKVIAAICQCCIATEDTAPIPLQTPRIPEIQMFLLIT